MVLLLGARNPPEDSLARARAKRRARCDARRNSRRVEGETAHQGLVRGRARRSGGDICRRGRALRRRCLATSAIGLDERQRARPRADQARPRETAAASPRVLLAAARAPLHEPVARKLARGDRTVLTPGARLLAVVGKGLATCTQAAA